MRRMIAFKKSEKGERQGREGVKKEILRSVLICGPFPRYMVAQSTRADGKGGTFNLTCVSYLSGRARDTQRGTNKGARGAHAAGCGAMLASETADHKT